MRAGLRALSTMARQPGPIEATIRRKLTEFFQPGVLQVVNDSHKHAGHQGNPSGDPDAETHFRITIGSAHFQGKSLLQQHRAVYGVLQDELQAGLHSIALKTTAAAQQDQSKGGVKAPVAQGVEQE